MYLFIHLRFSITNTIFDPTCFLEHRTNHRDNFNTPKNHILILILIVNLNLEFGLTITTTPIHPLGMSILDVGSSRQIETGSYFIFRYIYMWIYYNCCYSRLESDVWDINCPQISTSTLYICQNRSGKVLPVNNTQALLYLKVVMQWIDF